MATSWTYTTLKATLKTHCEDQGTTFNTELPNIVQLGEDRIVKDLPLSIFDAHDQDVAITQSNQVAPKPSSTIAIRDLYYVSGGARTILLPRTYSYCLDYALGTTEAAPKFYAEDYSETDIFLAPTPNLNVTAKANITKRPTSIVTASTTFIGTNLGDLLLAACMIAAERFNLAAEQSKDWAAEYATLLASARVDMRNLLRRDNSPMAPMPMATGKGER